VRRCKRSCGLLRSSSPSRSSGSPLSPCFRGRSSSSQGECRHRAARDRDPRHRHPRPPGRLRVVERPQDPRGPEVRRRAQRHELGNRLAAHPNRLRLDAAPPRARTAALAREPRDERDRPRRAGRDPLRGAGRQHEPRRAVAGARLPARVRPVRGDSLDRSAADRRDDLRPPHPRRRRAVRRQGRPESGPARPRRTCRGVLARLSQPLRRRADAAGPAVHGAERGRPRLGRRSARVHERAPRARSAGDRHVPARAAGRLRRSREPDARQSREHVRRAVAGLEGRPCRMRAPWALQARRTRVLQELDERLAETIHAVQDIPNHDDDGSSATEFTDLLRTARKRLFG
jgi:hypothetical protein